MSVPTKLIAADQQASTDMSKVLISDAVTAANTYLQGLKGNAGIPADQVGKSMVREKLDYAQMKDYADSQGLVGPVNSNDPSLAIRELGVKWAKTTDPTLRDQYHQQALKLAQGAGWLEPGQTVDSVNGMAQQTMAGTPNYESQQDAIALQMKMLAAQKSGSGSGGGGKGGDDSTSLANEMNQVKMSLKDGMSPKKVEAMILLDQPNLLAGGIKPDEITKLIDYVYMLQYGYGKKDYDTIINQSPAKQSGSE